MKLYFSFFIKFHNKAYLMKLFSIFINNVEFYFFHSTALHIAVKKRNIEIIETLLENKNIDINIKDQILLFRFS